MAAINRAQLNQSNQININGFGKVTKNRHSIHNNNIADYVDTQDVAMQQLLNTEITNVLANIGLLEEEIESIASGILPAQISTDPADNPTINAYFLVGGAGSYGNILTAASTPMTLSAPEAAEGLWMAYKGSDGYWIKLLILEVPWTVVLERAVLGNPNPINSDASDYSMREKVSEISFDGINMLAGDGFSYDPTNYTNFADWTYFTNGGAGTAGSENTLSFGVCAALNGTGVLLFKDGMFTAGTRIKLTIVVPILNGTLGIIIDDSTTPFGIEKMLSVGVNVVEFDSFGRTDTTIIIKSYDNGAKYIRSLKVETVQNSAIVTPLNVKPDRVDYFVKKEYRTPTLAQSITVFAGDRFDSGVDYPNTFLFRANGDDTTFNNTGYSASKPTLQENCEYYAIYREIVPAFATFGFISTNAFGYRHSVVCQYLTSNIGGLAGKLLIQGNPSVQIDSTAQNTNYTLGDVMKVGVIREELKYTFYAVNLTKGWRIEHDVQCTPLLTPFIAHNSARVGCMLYAGQINILDEHYSIKRPEGLDNIIVGDSITFGQAATTGDTRWASLVNGVNMVSGGGADTTAEVLDRLDEIIALRPKRVILMIGGNDIIFSVPSGTWQANLRAIRKTLVDAGIEVVHCFPTARTGAGTLISFLQSEPTFLTDLKIDCNTPTAETGTTDNLKASFDSGDDLHPNNAGMAAIAAAVNAVIG